MTESDGRDLLVRVRVALDEARRVDVAGRPVVLIAPSLAGVNERVSRLREDGVTDVLVLTWGDATEERPHRDCAQVHVLPPYAVRSVIDEVRAWQGLVDDPPQSVRDVVSGFDPGCQALVLLHDAISGHDFCGRQTYAARSRQQSELEDKTLCHDLWIAAGIACAPEEIIEARSDALERSAARLDLGDGVVVSADASDGMNGGAARVRRARTADELGRAFDDLGPVSRRLRVMPFLEGVPASIHGVVTTDGVIALRPVELVMLRPAGNNRFLQAGMSSWWDPHPEVRAQMRRAAHAVGSMLARQHAYRGAFGIDGIVTRDGFRPNELNPRFSAGISNLGRALDNFSIGELNRRILVRDDLPVSAAELEHALVAACDAQRFGLIYAPTDTRQSTQSATVVVTGTPHADALSTDDVRGVFEPTDDPERASGTLEIGPAAMGAIVRFTPTEVRPGERLAQWGLAAFEFSDREFGTAYGAMSAAPAVE